ncbi:hypothetical protein KEM54_000477 [Ascosphaera aggregata]|nr:hypothetical protein KEM54_000477 [Ascosphaera aggregata]
MFDCWLSKAEAFPPDVDVNKTGGESRLATLLDSSPVDAGLQRAFNEIRELRNELRREESMLFWTKLIKGMARTCKAQYAFITSPICPVDPEIRPAGIGYDNRHHLASEKVSDEPGRVVFEIPSVLPIEGCDLITSDLPAVMGEENMAKLPFTMQSYLCVPLPISRTRTISIGMMWTQEGLTRLDLPWTAVKLLVYAFEELVTTRAKYVGLHKASPHRHNLKKEGNVRQNDRGRRRVSTLHKMPRSRYPSFRAFAPHLSHELRTPMQGVVGMFDVVRADIEDIDPDNNIETAQRLKAITQSLEDARDSARRAVQAADNIIIAYELDMQIPDTPFISDDESPSGSADEMPSFFKWRQSSPFEAAKRRSWLRKRFAGKKRSMRTYPDVKSAAEEANIFMQKPFNVHHAVMDAMSSGSYESSQQLRQGQRAGSIPSTRIRDLLHMVIGECLHVGGRPEQISAETTDLSERFEVQSRSSNGRITTKKIEWSVESSVPEELFVREKDLEKLISCVFLNAVKFTETGEITVHVTLDQRKANFVLIRVKDSGSGIPEAFIPHLFEPFARENQSITRSSEGLGLGLLVAKGLSRRIGGDLTCVWSSIAPADHGSIFEISVPIGKGAAGIYDHVAEFDAEKYREYCKSAERNEIPVSPTAELRDSSTLSSDPSSPELLIATRDALSLSTALPSPDEYEYLKTVQATAKPKITTSDFAKTKVDRQLAEKYPLNCLVAEDNKIVREILVKLLHRLGYEHVYEAFDGRDAVEKMAHSICATTGTAPQCMAHFDPEETAVSELSTPQAYPTVPIDVIFMDIWLPRLDGFSAAKEILDLVEKSRIKFMENGLHGPMPPQPTVLFTTADLSEELHKEVDNLGSKLLLKPHGLQALQKAILEVMVERSSATTSPFAGREDRFSYLQTEDTLPTEGTKPQDENNFDTIATAVTAAFMKSLSIAALICAILLDARAVCPTVPQSVIRPDDGVKSGMASQMHDTIGDIISSSPLLSLHRSLSEIESLTNNEHGVGLWLAEYLKEHGFVVEMQPVEDEQQDPIDSDEEDFEAPPKRFNLYAYPPTAPPPGILLSSHIDTVPPFLPYSVDVPDTPDFDRGEVVIRGRGTVDAKACVAAQIIAACNKLAKDPSLSLGLLFVVGEETEGKGMKKFARSKYNTVPPPYHTVIFGEPTEHKLVAGHKGTCTFTITAKGNASHSGYPWVGRSAVSDILPVLSRIDVLGDVPESEGGLLTSPKFGKTTVNIGQITAGVALNVLPAEATARVLVRIASGTPDDARAIIAKAVKDYTPEGANISVDFESFGLGSGPVEIDADIEGFDVMTVNYFTDIPYLTFDDKDAKVKVKRYLYGPGSILVAHAPNEALVISDLEKAVVGYERLIDAGVARGKKAT